jgi:hypothetical protein
VAWQLGLFGDLGAVFGAPDNGYSGGSFVHPGVGAGIRVIYDDLFVARIDTAVGLDPIRQTNGELTDDWTWGFYVVFDHAF